jgi:hypothetical protein
MKGWALLVAGVISQVGCTAANPDYRPNSDGGQVIKMGDMALTPYDLVVIPLPDLTLQPECTAGQRSCQMNNTVAEACINGVFQPDRVCPIASMCEGGHCQPPPPMQGTTQGQICDSENQCLLAQNIDDSCEPFIDMQGMVEFHCSHSFGPGSSGNKCQAGSDCRSGYCIPSTQTCFRICNGSDTDCPVRNGVKTVCRPVTIRVEGIDVMTASCVPP